MTLGTAGVLQEAVFLFLFLGMTFFRGPDLSSSWHRPGQGLGYCLLKGMWQWHQVSIGTSLPDHSVMVAFNQSHEGSKMSVGVINERCIEGRDFKVFTPNQEWAGLHTGDLILKEQQVSGR